MKVISLSQNYRSHQSILDASFGMIEKNYDEGEHADLRIRLSAGIEETKVRPIEIVVGENTSAIEIHLVKELKDLTEKEPKATVAIIVRRNRELDRVIRLLESHNVPVSSLRSVDIFSHPVGRVFFDLLEYVEDPSRNDALARTIVTGLWDIPMAERAGMVREMKAGITSEVIRKLPALSIIHSKKLSDSPVGFFIHLANESSFIKLIARDPSYVHVWRGIVSLAESLTREGDIHDPAVLIEKILAYRTSAESRTVKISVGAPDIPVSAMTAHGSKGLEYDYVFIPYATEDAWVGRNRGASFVLPKKHVTDADIRDVRRLFYVAITRAKKHAVILASLEESDGKIFTPLRCIDELDEDHVSRVTISRADVDMVHVDTFSQKTGTSESDIALTNLAKRVLVEKGLSVTALNHFMECPSKFIYQSILKIPQAPSIPSEKGNAMHDAISHVWKSEKKDTDEIKTIFEERISAFFAESLLVSAEKVTAKKELLDDVPEVARALTSHFALGHDKKVLTESWVLGNFVSGDVTISIHGKMDSIIEADSIVDVYDYKTKQAMSIASIRGETKSSDGAYFRQLIFYRILIESDTRFRGKRVNPALVFVSPDEKGRCPTVSIPIEATDVARVQDEIHSLIDSVWSGKIASSRCDDAKCEWCGLRSLS